MNNSVQANPEPAGPSVVVEHNNAGLGQLTVKEYSLGGIDVFDVRQCKGVEGAYYPEHIISLLKRPFTFNANWEGHRFQNPWNRGNVVFIPAHSKLTHTTETPYDEMVIRLKHDFFVTAAREHIDFDQVDFTFRDITSWATWKFGVALSKIVMDENFSQWPGLVESAMLSLVLAIIKELSPTATQAFTDVKTGLSMTKRKRVLEYVDAHIADKITHADLAAICSLSVYHFGRKFKNQMGITPLRYVATRRVELAKKMLRSSSEPLAHISLACGFASQSHMTVAFKKITGATPGGYRLGMN